MPPERVAARCYNHAPRPRPRVPGMRRTSMYVAWSYPAESNRNIVELDNRFSTMNEVRRVGWPGFEKAEYSDPGRFQQGIAGTLELFFQAWELFQSVIEETTTQPMPMYQRVDHMGKLLPIDERILADTDALLVFGLDHNVTNQEALPAEIEALREFLKRDDALLLIGPHHDVGVNDDANERQMEYLHHGDALVPRQQRFGRYTQGLLKGLGVPVENRYGLRPAVVSGTKRIAPLSIERDLDTAGWLEGVTNFNFHMHLPHYAVVGDDANSVRVLARQPIDSSKPHPFTEAGNKEFNAFVWIPPAGERAGHIVMADSTIFSTLFGGDESLTRFWKNLVTVR